MSSAGEPALLRPLSFGEIFDRAVTLYATNAAAFALIALVVVAPAAIMQFILTLQTGANVTQLLDQIEHPGKTHAANPAGMALTFGMIGVSVVLGSFVVVAIASAVAALYRGEPVDWRASCVSALRQSGAIFSVLLGEIAGFALLVFAGAFAMGVVFVAAFLLVRVSAPLGVAAFAAAAIVGVLWLVAIMLCYVAFAFAFNAIAVERAHPGAALGSGFTRVFNRREVLRACLVCLALLAINVGLIVVSLAVTALFESLHLALLHVVVNAAISLVTTSFVGILLAVYYFDVRVRREGLDLQAQIERLQPIPSAP